MTIYWDKEFEKAWGEQVTFLEKLYEMLGQVVPPDQATFEIGRLCSICGKDGHWQLEGDPPNVFVCEHEPIIAGKYGIRQLDSIPISQVKYAKLTHIPAELRDDLE